MNQKKIMFAVLFLLAVIVVGAAYFWGMKSEEKKEISKIQPEISSGQEETSGGKAGVLGKLSESEARVIAEKTCIKEGETLSTGYYNENSKTWWFDANIKTDQKGCNPACVVSEETGQAEINWRCTGLITQKSSADEIQELFAKKYPKYADTVSVKINQEDENHARGSVSFVEGGEGGNFLAARVDGLWRIVFDGNGQIPCNLSQYGFPSEMLSDCAQ